MAAKKKPSKKKAVAKRSGTAMTATAMKEKLAGMAAKDTSVISDGPEKIGVKGRRFSYKGDVIGKELEVIIVAHTFENAYYTQTYSEDNPSAPACYALGDDPSNMVPAANCAVRQADTCNECEHDEWGSAETGKGKACNGKIKLLVVDANVEDAAQFKSGIETPVINVGSTTIKPFGAYIGKLDKRLGRPVCSVKTNLTFNDEVDYEKLDFESTGVVEDTDLLCAILEFKEDQAEDLLCGGYDPDNYLEPVPKKKSRKGTRKGKGKLQ